MRKSTMMIGRSHHFFRSLQKSPQILYQFHDSSSWSCKSLEQLPEGHVMAVLIPVRVIRRFEFLPVLPVVVREIFRLIDEHARQRPS